MFIRSFYYTLKMLIRQKSYVFWCLVFPIALGTMFYIGFSGLSDNEQFHAIPVAVVLEEAESSTDTASAYDSDAFSAIIDFLSEAGENQFLVASYTTKVDALALLRDKKVTGILYGGSPVTLAVSNEMSSAKLEQSILNSFVEQYNMNALAITDIAKTHPENLASAIDAISTEADYNKEITYANSGIMDEKLTYFFNLIAMTCMFASMGGMQISIINQANLSALGTRKCISPVNKMISLLGELCANFLFQFGCLFVSLFYLIFVLKINFGNQFGYIALASLVGCIMGVSFGFFVGSIGHISENTKMGILMAVSMLCSFLSGLMVGNMRIIVAQICPWFNHVNPAALIADSFYSLTVYQSHNRYFENLGTLLLISALFCLGGFLMVRREKYAAL